MLATSSFFPLGLVPYRMQYYTLLITVSHIKEACNLFFRKGDIKDIFLEIKYEAISCRRLVNESCVCSSVLFESFASVLFSLRCAEQMVRPN